MFLLLLLLASRTSEAPKPVKRHRATNQRLLRTSEHQTTAKELNCFKRSILGFCTQKYKIEPLEAACTSVSVASWQNALGKSSNKLVSSIFSCSSEKGEHGEQQC